MPDAFIAPPVPLRFDPSMEHVTADEAETQAAMIETLTKISETTFKHSGHATRGVHAKNHGVLHGELRVLDGLPEALAQGMFATAGRYPVVLRLSTIPGDILDDNVSTPRGLAIKVIGVAGARLPGSEADVTQDFVLVNGPAFGAPTAKKFLGGLKAAAATTDVAPGLKRVISTLARGTETVLEAFGGKSATVLTLGGHPETHILGETFYSQAPILYGPYAAKIAVAPVSPALTALTHAPLDMHDKPNALREAVVAYFAANDGEWEVRAQFCIDLATMPIEDASVAWPESESPYIAVARITVPRQDAWSPASVKEIDDGLSFSPWHGLAAHRPLGSVMRARKATYESSARFRASHNNCPRGQDAQQFRASGLNLVIAAIVHWNSTYLVDAIDHMRTQGKAVPAELLAQTSPLTWEHIGFSGDFLWDRAAETAGHRRPHNLGRERTAA